MSASSRFWRSVLFLLCMLPEICHAQPGKPQFVLPRVEPTFGQVTSFVVGNLQAPLTFSTDILYVNAPVVSSGASSITVGELLSQTGSGFQNLRENQIIFPNVAKVVAALGDFNNDKATDYAFALSTTVAGSFNLCVYFGSGLGLAGPAYDGTGKFSTNYPPGGGKSGCMTFPTAGSLTPDLAYIAAMPFRTGFPPQILIEDSANKYLYIFSNSGQEGFGGGLPGIALIAAVPIGDTGPIYSGDFNNDGYTDFIVNGQTSHTATVYLGSPIGPTGTFQAPVRYPFSVHSMLLEDMDGDKIADMLVEGDNGVIQIYPGKSDGTFATTSVGGTPTGRDGFSGNGGHLAALDPGTRNILTTTPIGLSVLHAPLGTLNYNTLQGIYDIGPGRTSFALADFYGAGVAALAVDSPEGVAFSLGDLNNDGGFQTQHAYAALAPVLGTAVGRFRTVGNPARNIDVVAATGAVEAQLLTGNGDGTFNTFPGVTYPFASLAINPPPANLWSNVVAGDFNGDGILDFAYSVTGLPEPVPGSNIGAGLFVQYGRGDGGFYGSTAVNPSTVNGAAANNDFYGESTVGDFNGDGFSDIANIDASHDVTLLGLPVVPSPSFSVQPLFTVGLNAIGSNTAFNQVAAGFFKGGRSSKQDLVVQEGAKLIPYVNSGDGVHFTAEPALSGTPSAPPYFASTLLLTDLDGDGNGDVVAVYYNSFSSAVGTGPLAPSQLYIWYGHGDGTFGTPQIVGLDRNDYLGAVADLNNDGMPDLILADGSLVTVLYNQGARNFGGTQNFLAGQGINSLSLADLNGDGTPDLIVGNGGATISNTLALGGATKSAISLTPNPDVNTGGITVLVNNVTTRPVTGSLVIAPEPSSVGATFTLTATITPSPGVTIPTGTVTFYVDGAQVGNPVALVPGATNSVASYTVPAGNTYSGGSHPVVAYYAGDINNSSLTLNATHVIVNNTTTTVLALCVGPTAACPSNGFVSPPYVPTLTMSYGQTWNGAVTVTASDGALLTGQTLINLVYNSAPSTVICTLDTAVLGAACPAAVGLTIGTSVGVNVLTGSYSGNATHSGSTSAPVTITVLPNATTASVTGAPNPSPLGQPVTFTATLTGSFAPPTGPVVFLDGGTSIGTATLVPSATGVTSTATLTTTTLAVGAHPITVSYAATLNFNASVSPVFTETITPLLTGSFALSVSPNPMTVGLGYSAGYTITVTPKNGFTQDVNLSCGAMPYETACSFVKTTIPGGNGGTTLFVGTMAPHSCGTTQPYFLGSNGGGPLMPLAVPALAGLLVGFFPGRRRWLRALVTIAVVAMASQISGCGNCTDLGTRPGTYTFTVSGAAASGPAETESQTVTLNVTI